jgi:hypothetical protein
MRVRESEVSVTAPPFDTRFASGFAGCIDGGVGVAGDTSVLTYKINFAFWHGLVHVHHKTLTHGKSDRPRIYG